MITDLSQTISHNPIDGINKVAKPKARISRILIGGLIAVSVLVSGALASLLVYQKAYADKVMPNLSFASQAVGGFAGQDLQETIKRLSEKFSDQKRTLVLSPKIKIESSNRDLGLSIDQKATYQEIFTQGKNGSLFVLAENLLSNTLNPKNIASTLKLDETQLNLFIEESLAPQVKAPTDAAIEFANNSLNIKDGALGLAVDINDFKANLLSQSQLDDSRYYSIKTKTIEPEVKKENLENIKTQLDELIAKPPTLTAGAKNLKMNPEDLFKLISFSKNENNQIQALISEETLDEYLRKNEARLVIKKVDQQVALGSGLVLREGKNGQKINRNQTKAILAENLNGYISGQSALASAITLETEEEPFAVVTLDPASIVAASAFAAASPTGKSVVVDISEQRLSAFENGGVVNTFLISSGLPNYESPRGSFSITRKVYSKWYRGTNRDGSVWSYPNTLYNMNFTGPYYLHGTYWHNNFGKKMSHGCINIAYPNAEWLWNWSEIGTPVVVQE